MHKKNLIIALSVLVAVVAAVALFLSLKPSDGIMTRRGDAYIVNTTKLTPKVRGYGGAVPLEVTIRGEKITELRALANQETPEFFNSAKNKLFRFYKGKTVSEALRSRPDAMTGATYSSGAIIANVQAALKYYQEKK